MLFVGMVLEVYDVMDPMGRSLFVLNDTDTIESEVGHVPLDVRNG